MKNRFEIEAELMRLSADFAFYLDNKMFDELANLFTPDAIWDRVMQTHRGQDEIREAMANRPVDIVTRHVQTNFRFEHQDENTVRGRVYMTSYHGPSEGGALPGLLHIDHSFILDFHDLYVRTPDGWRFAERIGRPALLPANSPMRKSA